MYTHAHNMVKKLTLHTDGISLSLVRIVENLFVLIWISEMDDTAMSMENHGFCTFSKLLKSKQPSSIIFC